MLREVRGQERPVSVYRKAAEMPDYSDHKFAKGDLVFEVGTGRKGVVKKVFDWEPSVCVLHDNGREVTYRPPLLCPQPASPREERR